VLTFGSTDGRPGGQQETDQSDTTSKPLKRLLDHIRWIGLPFIACSMLVIVALHITTNSLIASALLFFVESTL
jgi:hypothetical protein